jgi:hypothetical protein
MGTGDFMAMFVALHESAHGPTLTSWTTRYVVNNLATPDVLPT